MVGEAELRSQGLRAGVERAVGGRLLGGGCLGWMTWGFWLVLEESRGYSKWFGDHGTQRIQGH